MVRLREFIDSDIKDLVRILNTPEVTYYLSSKIPNQYSLDDAKWWVTTGSKQALVRAIEFDGTLVGCIGIKPGVFEYARSGEIGYWLDKAYWGKGIVPLAVEAMLEVARTQTDLVRIFATIFSGNTQSERVVAKAGFELEGRFKQAIFKHERFFDAAIYAKIIRR